MEEIHYLAPGAGKPKARRRALAERVEAIKLRRAVIKETYDGGVATLPQMLMRGYEQIATSGRSRNRHKEGRPPKWPSKGVTLEDYRLLWQSRAYGTDPERVMGIIKKFGSSPSSGWLRTKLGSPHRVEKEK